MSESCIQNEKHRAERYACAMRVLDTLEPGAAERLSASLAQPSGDFSAVILTFAFTDIVDRPGIDLRTREMLTVAALTAMGTASRQLGFNIRAALNVGVTREEIIKIIM